MEKYEMNNGRLGLSSTETLYSHVQKVYLKYRTGEDNSKMLRLTMEIKSELTLSAGKVLCLQITDDNDCAFYYSLLLTHDDFSILKCQQGLLVDFDHFSTQLIKLFDACKTQDITNKFILVLDEEDSLIIQTQQNNHSHNSNNNGSYFLKVIEKNNFKNLCHLSLKVQQGSDSDVKTHMSLKISNLTEKLTQEVRMHKTTEMNLNEALKALDIKTKELAELQLKLSEEKNNLKLETSHQISEEREKLTKLQMEWQQRLEMEKSQLIMQYQKQVNDLNEQINLLTFNNKNLYESRCQLDTSLKEKNFQMEALEKQVLQLTQETVHLKKQSSQLDQDYHEQDKIVIALKTKLAVAEQELKDKAKYLEKQQELLKSATEQKQFLEEALNDKEMHMQRKQAAVQGLSSDLMKCNDVIAKLQADLAASKAKMKLRTDIALEQEKVLEKKSLQLAAQSQAINELNEKVTKLEDELTSVKAELEEAKKDLEEKETTIKKNNNVINWLNRRLTESNTSSANSTNLISSSRSEIDPVFQGAQPKGNLTNLTKGWPPWLVNSVNGLNSSRSNTPGLATSNVTNYNLQQTASVHIADGTKHSSGRSAINECSKEQKIQVLDEETEKDEKSQGLDPKYFQSMTDKDYVTNNQLLNPKNDSWKKTSAVNTAIGRKQTSTYFPKKTVAL
ncbi:hypothetical protein RUM43_011028 [Polyplax serrata]|uniref:Spindle assembly abnormal protein 6 N-terminal domain-containing protein n=1 Tax=Polyplax serrata TaxID=468196 RepID=A0AAN8RT99_POLSC